MSESNPMPDEEKSVMQGIELAWEHHIDAGDCPDEMYRVVVAKRWKEREILNTNWFPFYPEEFLREETERGNRIVSVDVYALKARSR